MNKIITRNLALFSFLALTSFAFSQTTITDSGLFTTGPNNNWTHVYTLALTADGSSSQATQTLDINITSLPTGGANYRVFKTTANGGNFYSGSFALSTGLNEISVGGVAFDRTVKIQFSSGLIGFDSLVANGTTVYDSSSSDDGTDDGSDDGSSSTEECISDSDSFEDGPNATWVKLITLALTSDGASSQGIQTLDINVTSLPSGGANYRVYKTTSNGGNFWSNASALSVGANEISVAGVSFDRTVKVQFSSADVCYDSLIKNDVTIFPADSGSGDDSSTTTYQACTLDFSFVINTSSSTYPKQIILAEDSDSSSSDSQNLTMNITNLPDGGVRYQVVKTLANGNLNYANPVTVTETGNLSITVAGASFQRDVKIRFDSTELCFDSISVNGSSLMTWTGATDTDWATTTNWVFNNAPDSTTKVNLPASLSNYPSISTDVSLTELSIDSGASATVTSTGSLTTSGDLSNSGTFTMTGSSTENPSLVVGGTSSGDITYNRYVNTVGSNEWDLIGSPVDGLSVEDFLNANSSIATNNSSTETTISESSHFEAGPNTNYPKKITLTTVADGASSQETQTLSINITSLPSGGANYRVYKTTATSNFTSGPSSLSLGSNSISVSSVEFDRTVNVRFSSADIGFNSLTVNGTSLYNGIQPETYAVGYYDNATSTWNNYDDDNFNVGSPALDLGKGFQMASSSGSTLSFSGSVATSQQTSTIVDNSSLGGTQWNLIANPFPSYLNLNSAADATNNFITQNGLSVYGWSADGSGTYIVYNNVSPTPAASYIAPGQGFFVGAADGTTSVNFTAAMRTTSGGDDFVADRLSGSYTYFYLDMLNQNGNSIDNGMFYFDDNMTHGYDQGYDAESFDQSSSLMSRLLNGYEGTGMQVNAMPASSLDDSTIIPLEINRGAGTAFAISLGDSFNIPADVDIYLEDREAQTFTDLKNGDFSITPTSNISGTGRFYLVFGTNSLGSDDFDMSHINAYKPFNADHLVIEGLLNIETASLFMYNIIGQEVLNINLNTNQAIEKVSTLGMNAGVYIVNIQADNNTITKKIIIN
nr:conserved hypothetical protein [uncultured bacterium]